MQRRWGPLELTSACPAAKYTKRIDEIHKTPTKATVNHESQEQTTNECPKAASLPLWNVMLCVVFKQTSDNYGHQAGDAVLREVARRGKKALRSYAPFGRYGGE